jgi:hypothetical protein
MRNFQRNIYHKLIKNENTLTEAFCNLLQFDVFRNCFIELLTDKTRVKGIEFEYECVISQCREDSGGQPDIKIITIDNKIILLENKIKKETAITLSQQEFYKKEIFNILLFLLPDDYNLPPIPNNIQNVYKLPWSCFYNFMKTKNFSNNIAIDHFLEFIKNWFCMPEIYFTKDEVIMIQTDQKIPKIMADLSQILINVSESLKKQELKIETKFVSDGASIYLKDDNRQRILWFGIWYKLWQQHGHPLSFGVCDDWDFPINIVENFKKLFTAHISLPEEDGNKIKMWYCQPLPVELYLKNDETIVNTDSLAEYIKDQYENLRKSLD